MSDFNPVSAHSTRNGNQFEIRRYYPFRHPKRVSLILSATITLLSFLFWDLSGNVSVYAQTDFDDGSFESAIEQLEGRSWANETPTPYGSATSGSTNGGPSSGIASPLPADASNGSSRGGGFFSNMAGGLKPTSSAPKAKKQAKRKAEQNSGKKGLFSKLRPEKETPPPSEESIVNVGPRDYQPSTDMLFRLPMPIIGRLGLMEPGFYLVKAQAAETGKQLGIYQRNQLMVTVTVRPAGSANTNSPVTPIAPKNPLPAVPTVGAKLDEFKQNVILTLKEGDLLYESAPIPIIQR